MDARWQRGYWQLTALLLAAHFGGWSGALPLVVLLNVLQVNHAVVLRRSLGAMDVQVRIAYLGLLALGSVGPLWPLHVVQFVGVNALLIADYCLLARLLVLLPWHRRGPLSWHLLRCVLLSPPAPGAVVSRLAA
jgi:hypothetical protein